MVDLATAAFVTAGLLFYLAGTVGLLRLPDLNSRLHALTKADNLGLGLLVLGLALQADSALAILKLLLIWLLVMASSAAGSHLIAQFAGRRNGAQR